MSRFSSSDLPLTIADAAAALRAHEVTSTALTHGILERIERLNPELGAFIVVTADGGARRGRAGRRRLRGRHRQGSLQGIPLGIKDILADRDAPDHRQQPGARSRWVRGATRRWSRGSAQRRGRGNHGQAVVSEFAIGMPDPETGFPVPRNPWNPDHRAAGSSSGTGGAVAAGLLLGGLGTDTGGSVRGPAAPTATPG